MSEEQGNTDFLVGRVRGVLAEFYDRMKGRDDYGGPKLRDFTRAIHRLEDGVDRFEHGDPEVERIPYSEGKASMGDEKECHESFGMIQINRVTGGGRKLFGSHLRNHQHYITLRIMRAERHHGLDEDSYYPRRELIEISMSAAQFANLITSLNVGSGTPCTLHTVAGIRMEEVPEEVYQEHQKIREGFEKKIDKIAERLEEVRDEFDEMLQEKTISKKKAREMMAKVAKSAQDMRLNAPFVVSQFQESAERVVTHAKAEVEAFTSTMFRQAGIEAIADGWMPALTSGEPTKPAKRLPDEGPVEIECCPECNTPYGDDAPIDCGTCRSGGE